ncbi:MAG: GNAT family N-acetyltransferase [Elioraea sp.]|nr:GNAT family N-acetyltransferase [Elioraea sp.]
MADARSPIGRSPETALIRPAEAADLAAVTEIVRAAFRPYVSRIGREPGPMGDDHADLIAAGRLHVAVRDGVVVGLVVLIPRGGTLLLDTVAVAPEVQGTGVGRLLLDFAERVAVAQGYDTITLYTNEAMTEAIALYRRLGYAETECVEEKGFRRVYMRKPLSRP